MATGKLIIISAPSGSGKSSIIKEVVKDKQLRLEFSVSATTRSPRAGELDGHDYYFMSVDEFKKKISHHEFAEYQEVYPGRYYGTLKSELQRIMADGDNVILDVDVLGGVNVKKMYADQAVSIFIKAPSVEVLRQRLHGRGTDSDEEIEKRLSKAEYELTFAHQFDHIVVNDSLPDAVSDVHKIIQDFIA